MQTHIQKHTYIHKYIASNFFINFGRIKDGKELPENPRIKRDAIKGKDEVKLFLTIIGAEIEDSGEFEVLARNSEGEAIDSARLSVKSEF